MTWRLTQFAIICTSQINRPATFRRIALGPAAPSHHSQLRRIAADGTGEAPGYTAGLQQIDIRIPANAPHGPSVPLVSTVGGANTAAGGHDGNPVTDFKTSAGRATRHQYGIIHSGE